MPSYIKTGKYKFHWLTRGIYDAIKEGGLIDPYALYWIKDQNIIFRGEQPLMDVYAFVDDFQTPYTGDIKPKTLCIKTSDVEGEAFLEARILKEDYTWETVVPPVYGEITELTEDDKSLPTRYAVKTFIDDRLDALREYFDALENSMREMLQTAQQASEAAYDASVEAVTAANNAENSAIQAESYTKGGTDTRPGENTDNAKYYKDKAQEAAATATGEEETIAQMKESIEHTADEVERDRQDVASMKESVELSEQNAATSESNAHNSEVAAKASEDAAHDSEVAAKASEDAAALSEQHAAASETAAHNSEVAAAASATAALSSEGKAKTSETNAKASENAAALSETNAHNSEVAAALSETNAHNSEVAAAGSAAAALTSEQHALASEQAAAGSASAALTSEQHALASEQAAAGSAANALTSEQHASTFEGNASNSASAALTSEQHAAASETAAANSATLAESWAVGGTDTRPGEDENNAKYWADQSRSFSPITKADKVIGATAGDVAGLDNEGNLTDTGVPADNIAQKDGYYAGEGLGAATAENLIDPYATPSEASYGFRTTAGDISISEHGVANITEIQGITEVPNQIVPDDYNTKKVTGNGSIAVTDAVTKAPLSLELRGDSFIRNQIVQNGNFSDGTTNFTSNINYGTLSVSDNILKYTCVEQNTSYSRFSFNFPLYNGHTYLFVIPARCQNDITFDVNINVMGKLFTGSVVGSSDWTNVSYKKAITTTQTGASVFIRDLPPGEYIEFKMIEVIDLTLLFNNNTTKINAINTWEDLVALYPEYANYVNYNLGEVVGSNANWIVNSQLYNESYLGEKGYYLNNRGEKVALSGEIYITDYIPVMPGWTLHMHWPDKGGTASSTCFYDSNKTFVSGVRHDINGTSVYDKALVVPDNCYWVRDTVNGKNGYAMTADTTTLSPTTSLLADGGVYDKEDVILGKHTQRFASYTFKSNDSWLSNSPSSYPHLLGCSLPDDFKSGGRAIIGDYPVTAALVGWSTVPEYGAGTQIKKLYVNDPRYTESDMAAHMAGKTVYYELATPVVTDVTPTELTLQAGNNSITQTSGAINNTPIYMKYDGTDFAYIANNLAKYITRINGTWSYVTNTTAINAVCGRDMIFDLTKWFYYGNEPTSIDEFWQRVPNWKGLDIPYSKGEIMPFIGTAVKSVFFNAYNNATGTAELLGGNEYQICGTYASVEYTTLTGFPETLTIDENGIFTPVENGILTVTGGNDTDTCVHLTWSGYRNYGEPQYKFEPYGEFVRQLSITDHFPQGMNGIGTVCDELYPNKSIQRWGVKVFDGTENWIDESSYNSKKVAVSGMKEQRGGPGVCNWYPNMNNGHTSMSSCCNFGFASTNNIFIVTRIDMTLAEWKQYLADQYAAGTPLTIVYPLATAVETSITPEINMSYAADDFGTEQLLPANDLTMRTANMDALIRYNLDFTRLGVHLSEIWPYLEDFAKNNDHYARTDGYYKKMTVGLAENLIDIHADGETRVFQRDTACGETSISDDGNAGILCMKGFGGNWFQGVKPPIVDGVNNTYWRPQNNDITVRTDDMLTVGTLIGWESRGYSGIYAGMADKWIKNHKYFVSFEAMADIPNGCGFNITTWGTGYSTNINSVMSSGVTGDWKRYVCIVNGTRDEYAQIRFAAWAPSGSNIKDMFILSVRNINIIDLTLLYGYGKEPSLETFEHTYNEPVYDYEGGRFATFKGTDMCTVGFNQFDYTSGSMRVLPQQYQITGPGALNYYSTPIEGTPTVLTYGSVVTAGVFYRIDNEWYRAILGIPEYDTTVKHYLKQCVVYNGSWYRCIVKEAAIGEFDAENWEQISLDDALANRVLFHPLAVHPDADGLFTPPGYGYLYCTGATAETCIHLTWSGYRNGEFEEYWREERSLPVSQYFPNGMIGAENINSTEYVADELYTDKAINRFGIYTFTGTENWVKSTGTPFYWEISPSPISANMWDASKSQATRVEGLAQWAHTGGVTNIVGTNGSNLACMAYNAGTMRFFVRVDSCDTLEKIQAYMAGRKLYYPLKTPVVTPINPPLNLTYKVADFGTEQVLPSSPSLPTTAFNGIVRYSTDFTRELVHIVDEHVRERVDEMEATMPDLAHKDGIYQQMTVGNSYNMIDRHAEGTDRQIAYDTSCGTASISDDGSAEVQQLQGNTVQLQNLVADTAQNVYKTGEGYVELPYAYGGEIQPVIYGQTLVPNQLVPDEGNQQDITLWSTHQYYTNIGGIESIQTGLSTITVTPGTDKITDLTQMFFPGHEPTTVEEMKIRYPSAGTGSYSKGSFVNAQHGVWTTPVWNQRALDGNFSNGSGWLTNQANYEWFTVSVSNNVGTITCIAENNKNVVNIYKNTSSVTGTHYYFVHVEVNPSFDISSVGIFTSNEKVLGTNLVIGEYNTLEAVVRCTVNTNQAITFHFGAGCSVGDTIQVRNLQMVDLTQMFGVGYEPTTKDDALSAFNRYGKSFDTYNTYDTTGTPIGGTIDLSESDLTLRGFIWYGYTTETTTDTLEIADSYDPANNQVCRLSVTYTFTGQETSWKKITDSSYPNGYYYRYDTSTTGQIHAMGANTYPYLACDNNAFALAKQGGANQFEHSISVIGNRYICICTSETLDALKAEIAGTSIVYRKNSWSVATVNYVDPLPTTPAGGTSFRQIAGNIPNQVIRSWYEATEYDIKLVNGREYWYRHDGVDQILRYNSNTAMLHVVAGQDQLATRESLNVATLDELFAEYPFLKTLNRLPYGGTIINYDGTGIKTVGFNLLNILATQGSLTGWATTNVPRKFEEGKFYVGFKADNTINTAYAQFISASASQVSFRSRNYYGLLYPMRCFPATQYQFTGTRNATNNIRNRMVFYDINGAWISAIEYNANANDNALFTTPDNAYWMCLLLATSDGNLSTTRNESNPCVHLTWSGYRNGDYENYWEETRELPVAERFPTGMNGIGSTHDTLNSAGTIQRYADYTFTGDESISNYTYTGFYFSFSPSPTIYGNTANANIEGMQRLYSTSYLNRDSFTPVWTISGTTLVFHVPGIRTIAQMKAWLAGKRLVYRLGTDTPLAFDEPVNMVYKVADFGTEQMVPDNPTDALPTHAALTAIIRYNTDMARTITKLPKDYISAESLDSLNAQLGTAMGGVITSTWDANEQQYTYTFTRTPTVVTLAAGTNAHTLQPNISYIHAPTTAGVTYTLAVPTDTTIDNEITLDVTQPSSGNLVFKQGTTTLTLQKVITPSAGTEWRYLCLWQFGGWKVYPIQVL